MTFEQLPEADQEKIKEIIKAGDEKYQMRYLLQIYYEHIAPVSDWRKEMDFAVGCANCQTKVLRYFKRRIK